MGDGLFWVLVATFYVLLVVAALRLFRFAPDDHDWLVPDSQKQFDEKSTDRH